MQNSFCTNFLPTLAQSRCCIGCVFELLSLLPLRWCRFFLWHSMSIEESNGNYHRKSQSVARCRKMSQTSKDVVKCRRSGVARGLLPERPCNFNTETSVFKVGNLCSALGHLLASRILYALLRQFLVFSLWHEAMKSYFMASVCYPSTDTSLKFSTYNLPPSM